MHPHTHTLHTLPHPQAAKTYLEKHFESFPSASLDELISKHWRWNGRLSLSALIYSLHADLLHI